MNAGHKALIAESAEIDDRIVSGIRIVMIVPVRRIQLPLHERNPSFPLEISIPPLLLVFCHLSKNPLPLSLGMYILLEGP
jgi:hypothetical protein